jgi:hypothetical protein
VNGKSYIKSGLRLNLAHNPVPMVPLLGREKRHICQFLSYILIKKRNRLVTCKCVAIQKSDGQKTNRIHPQRNNTPLWLKKNDRGSPTSPDFVIKLFQTYFGLTGDAS